MKNIQTIETVLTRMAELFQIGELYDWANVLDEFANQFTVDPSNAILKIRSLYGGMGSLNDIVLHKDGQPLVKENDEFDILSTELYELSRQLP